MNMIHCCSIWQANPDAKAEYDAICQLGPGNNKEEKKRVILRAWCEYQMP
jgi:hypothetical protein